MSSDKIEPCAGCGAMSNGHPIIGIKRDESGSFESFPVCDPCWRDPAHRRHKLKMHFFPASMEGVALSRAGSTDIG